MKNLEWGFKSSYEPHKPIYGTYSIKQMSSKKDSQVQKCDCKLNMIFDKFDPY
jgi:hypothetical protein